MDPRAMRVTRCLGAVLSACIAGCGGDGAADPKVQACDVQYADLILQLVSIRDARSGTSLGEASISAIKLNGVGVSLAAVSLASSGISIAGSELRCTTPCGFSTSEGVYTFDVGASGYKTATVTVNARYSTWIDGCPSVIGGGMKLDITLEPI